MLLFEMILKSHLVLPCMKDLWAKPCTCIIFVLMHTLLDYLLFHTGFCIASRIMHG